MAWLGVDFKVQYLDTLDQALILSGFIVCQRERNIWMLWKSNEYEKASQDDALGPFGLSTANENP